MADLNKIIDELSKLTVVEAAELSKQLEEKWGVTAATAVAAAPPAGAAATGAAAVTPHFSSNCFERSAASTTVSFESSSIILFKSAIENLFLIYVFLLLACAKIAIFAPGASKILIIFCAGVVKIPTILALASAKVGSVAIFSTSF